MLISNMDVIFNTIPSMVLDGERILNINQDTLIDIASVPGGVIGKDKDSI